ncbi:MAG: transcriptional activator RfaH [Afipia sp.]|nr:transcriptional activator RfaH [Afipia sp.]
MTGTLWYVVHTRPNSEAKADFNLRRQGFTTYLPRYQRQRRHARKSETVTRPLFPRYLFVELDLAFDQWRSIRSTFGISQIVLAGDRPRPLPVGVVDEIRARESETGFVKLGLPAGVKPGSKIRLLDGVFADSTAVFEQTADDRRVAVVLSLLGREVRVFVAPESVATA